MATPPMTLEQALAQHGDTLYRIALVLSDDAQRAAQALRQTVQRAAQNGTIELPDLLGTLVGILDQQRTKRRWSSQRTRRFSTDGPLYRGVGTPSPFASLSFEQRCILTLHLLLGYDPPRIAQVLHTSDDQSRDTMAAALVALADAGGQRLPSAVSSDQCGPVRAHLMRESDRLATDATVRGHLPLCSLCRAFDATWSALNQQGETALRNGLRNHTLPRDLAAVLANIVQTASEPRSWFAALLAGGTTSFIAIPVIVLLVIGALVLPGFLRAGSVPSNGAALPPAEGRALVQKALALIDQPPAGQGVWHAQWETIWFFPNGSYAPIYADAWLDTANPARHRLQAVHGGGGALYELQVGNGSDQLWYAIGATYYSSIYGDVGVASSEPHLIRRSMDAAAQRQAVSARLHSGIWNIGPAYLQEAYNAPSLHTLGRQPLGDRTVQIVSFSAPSPLGFPRDDERTKPTTILLGLDVTDGRLRSVTELVGPAGGEQSNRVTWRLQSEEWITDPQKMQQAFDARAWNGRGRFPPKAEGTSIDSTLLLYNEQQQAPLDQLLASSALAPNDPPTGTTRLAIQQPELVTTSPSAILTYQGEGRQLFLTWQAVANVDTFTPIGANLATITAAPNQHYHAVVATQQTRVQPTLGIVIDAQGFSKAELTDFIKGFQPLNLAGWQRQQPLLPSPTGTIDPLREALVTAVGQELRPDPSQAVYRKERVYLRTPPISTPLADPYHNPPDDAYPATATREQWIAERQTGEWQQWGGVRLNRLNANGATYAFQYQDQDEQWSFRPDIKVLERWQTAASEQPMWLSERAQAAYMLLSLDARAQVQQRPDGSQVISLSQPYTRQLHASLFQWRWPYLPSEDTTILIELTLNAQNQPIMLHYSAVNDNQPLLLASWELEEERLVAIDGTPAELRNGAAPTGLANLVNDYRQPAWALPIRTTNVLSDVLGTARSTLYVLPANDATTLGKVEFHGAENADIASYARADEIGRGFAIRLQYYVNGDWRQSLRLTEGPAAQLRAYLRTQSADWTDSKATRLVVAGRETNAWLLEGPAFTRRIVVERDDTLLIAEGNTPWFEATAIPLLAALEPIAPMP